MPGLFQRLFGMPSGEPPHPAFTLELPDGWVGAYGPADYVEALDDHARDFPDDHDRVLELKATVAGAEDFLYMAGSVRGPSAGLIVTADAMQPGGLLTLDDELDAWVEGNLDFLTAENGVVGDPIVSTVEQPYAGRELRWSERFEEGPPGACISSCYATAGHVWTLSFTSEIGSARVSEEAFRAIATSFCVTSLPGDSRVSEPESPGEAADTRTCSAPW